MQDLSMYINWSTYSCFDFHARPFYSLGIWRIPQFSQAVRVKQTKSRVFNKKQRADSDAKLTGGKSMIMLLCIVLLSSFF